MRLRKTLNEKPFCVSRFAYHGYTLIKHSEVSSKGYTLIEILVGLTIVSILFGVGYAGFREFAARQVLTSSYNELNSNLTLAQQLALTGQKPGSCPSPLDGYEVLFREDSYTVSAKCGNQKVEIKKVDLVPSILLESSVPTILFKVLGQGTDIDGSVDITLKLKVNDKKIDAVLTKDGKLSK